jgi:hypothetical protein
VTHENEIDLLRRILQDSHVIAVVGLSNDPSRPSYDVSAYMQRHGYRIVPINPGASEILGEQAYPDLLSVPFDVDIVNIFRRPEQVEPHVEEAIRKGAQSVWMQLGIQHDAAARRARGAGLPVVQDRCIKIEHMRLLR